MDAYVLVEAEFVSFLNSALDTGEWSVSRPNPLRQGKGPLMPIE